MKYKCIKDCALIITDSKGKKEIRGFSEGEEIKDKKTADLIKNDKNFIEISETKKKDDKENDK